jgi:hypothetical protein
LVGMSNVDEWYAFCCYDGSTCYSHRSDNFIISFTPLVQAAAPLGFVVDSFHLRGGCLDWMTGARTRTQYLFQVRGWIKEGRWIEEGSVI